MDVQFELPSRRDVSKCVVTKETIEQGLRPTLVTQAVADEPTPTTSSARSASPPSRRAPTRLAGVDRVSRRARRLAVALRPAAPPARRGRAPRRRTVLDAPPNGCTSRDLHAARGGARGQRAPGAGHRRAAPGGSTRLTLAGRARTRRHRATSTSPSPLRLVATGRGAGDDRRRTAPIVRSTSTRRRSSRACGSPAARRTARTAAGAGVRVVPGRLALRDSAIAGNAGASALELLGDDGMTARDSAISANVGAGIVDRGGGGLRTAHTAISDNERHRHRRLRGRQRRRVPRRDLRQRGCAGSRSSTTATSPRSTCSIARQRQARRSTSRARAACTCAARACATTARTRSPRTATAS